MMDIRYKKLNEIAIRERYRQSMPLFEALSLNEIPFVVHKGAPLSRLIYGNPFHRISGDIDLLIPREHIDETIQTFVANGFRQGKLVEGVFVPATRQELIFHMAHTHQTMPFYKDTHNPLCPFVCLDINTEIYWGESGIRTDIFEFLSDRRQIELFDGNSVTALSSEKMFIATCLHHYKDMHSTYLLYSRNGFPRSHLEDIVRFVNNVKLDYDLLISITRKLNAEQYIFACLYAAEKFGLELNCRRLLDLLYSCEYIPDFISFGLSEEELRTWPEDPVKVVNEGRIREVLDTVLSGDDVEKIRLNSIYVG